MMLPGATQRSASCMPYFQTIEVVPGLLVVVLVAALGSPFSISWLPLSLWWWLWGCWCLGWDWNFDWLPPRQRSRKARLRIFMFGVVGWEW